MERSRPWLAGIVAALVGFSSSFTVVLAGLRSLGATRQQAASGLLTVSILMGVLGIALSARHRAPISVVWSTPGAALLVATGTVKGGFSVGVSAFAVCGALTAITALLQPLRALVLAIPRPLANGLLAGVLLKLCIVPATSLVRSPLGTLPVVGTWLLLSRTSRRWAVPGAMAVALIEIVARSGTTLPASHGLVPSIVVTAPSFSLEAVTLGVSLFVVTMASQNVPGVAVLDGFGFAVPIKEVLATTGFATVGGALLGGHVINLAAITASLSAGPDAGEKDRRWLASVCAGGCYVVFGLSAGLLSTLVARAPLGLVETVAGLALIGAMGSALAAFTVEKTSGEHSVQREAAVVTFLVTASGIAVAGIGSAFWGLAAGLFVLSLVKIQSKARLSRVVLAWASPAVESSKGGAGMRPGKDA